MSTRVLTPVDRDTLRDSRTSGLVRKRRGKAPPLKSKSWGRCVFEVWGDLRVTTKNGLHPNEVIEAMVIFGARTVVIVWWAGR